MDEFIVYAIVAAAAIALFLKIRKGIKDKGKCGGCNGCSGSGESCSSSEKSGQSENSERNRES